MSPDVVPCANATVCAFRSCGDTSTLVMSQPWRPPTVLVPGRWFIVPNVPLVSRVPTALLIWEAKKLYIGLLGPNTRAVSGRGVVAPKRIESPTPDASPSKALTASRPASLPVGGVQKPLACAGAAPDCSAPMKMLRLRTGSEKFSYTTARVQPAELRLFSEVPCVPGTPPTT